MSSTSTDWESGTTVPFPCNTIVGSDNLLGGGVAYTDYGYLVNGLSARIFLVLFAIVTCAHIGLSVYWRKSWTLLTFALGGAVETIGWGGRFCSWHTTVWDPNQGGQWNNNNQGYLMQITSLVIAPTFFSAGNYILLGVLAKHASGQGSYSTLAPSTFSILFTVADVICLIVQGLGGGLVGGANTDAATKNGLHVMAVGVVLQVGLTIVFAGLLAEFAFRLGLSRPTNRQFDLLGHLAKACRCMRRRRPVTPTSSPADGTRPDVEKQEAGSPQEIPLAPSAGDDQLFDHRQSESVKTLTFVVAMSSLLIFIRGVYRSDELLGFSTTTSGAYANQNLFLGMDATLMLLLLVSYIPVHPGLLRERN